MGFKVARIHTGISAQWVAAIVDQEGLDVSRNGFWCKDPVIETEKYQEPWTHVVTETVLSEDGRPKLVEREVTEIVDKEREVPVLDERDNQLRMLSIRYEKLVTFLASAQETRLSRIEAA